MSGKQTETSQTTQDVVNAHEPANHNRYGHAFAVGGKNFAEWELPAKGELEIGKCVLVYYDPLNLNKNSPTEFRDMGINSLGPVPIILFGIGAIAWYIRTRRLKNKSKSSGVA
jgi:hypothetical protein